MARKYVKKKQEVNTISRLRDFCDGTADDLTRELVDKELRDKTSTYHNLFVRLLASDLVCKSLRIFPTEAHRMEYADKETNVTGAADKDDLPDDVLEQNVDPTADMTIEERARFKKLMEKHS